MNQQAIDFAAYIESDEAPVNNKQKVISEIQQKYTLTKDGIVYYCDYFAVRFCFTKNNGFSNTILSLSKLQKFDKIPFFVVLVKATEPNKLFLANTTFLKKISHSSMMLSEINIKGSFNGSDIIKCYDNIDNCAARVRDLYAYHVEAEWHDNLTRLVEATTDIKGRNSKFIPNSSDLKNIYTAPSRAEKFVNSVDFQTLKQDLDERVSRRIDAIMVVSHVENVNIRGRLIEYLITADEERYRVAADIVRMQQQLPTYDTHNDLGDYVRHFENNDTYTDVKTKIIYLTSNPKAYNIDKFLECMSKSNSVFSFYFVGIDDCAVQKTILCSVFDSRLIEGTHIQHHWAGRNSRGVTQFYGTTINKLLMSERFENQINVNLSTTWIDTLISK